MRTIQKLSTSNPLDQKVLAEALNVLFKAQSMGLVTEPIDVFRIDFRKLQSMLKQIGNAGIGTNVLKDVDEWHTDLPEIIQPKLRRLAEILEESPTPDTEWGPVRQLIPDGTLIRLLGGISVSSLHRYSDRSRPTPPEIAERLHVIALIIGDLSGSYDALGVAQWFTRPRKKAFDNKTPLDLLTGNWKPHDPAPAKVREFAKSLNYSVAT
jgi:hypothetical protein